MNKERLEAAKTALLNHDWRKVSVYFKAGVVPNALFGIAIIKGDVEAVEFLIASGGEPESDESNLWVGVRNNQFACIELILTKGDFSQRALSIALQEAAAYNRPELCDLFIAHGAEPENETEGITPLMVAIESKSEQAAIHLAMAGKTIDCDKKIPLMDDWTCSRLTIRDAAERQGMLEFLKQFCSSSNSVAGKANKFSNIITWSEVLKAIESAISELPLGREITDLQYPYDAGACKDYIEFLREHDGSGSLGIIPMPTSHSLVLYSLAESQETREMMIELWVSETNQQSDSWWAREWVPIGDNGIGDLLYIETVSGAVRFFSHEARTSSFRAGSFSELLKELATGLTNAYYCYCQQKRAVV
ncbi:MAG TPA: SMI1/KNR4 family protein [Pirellulaceae bacterium]|nr:SMI1/KNR4 family protein [Pirellulaceae bacterium]HMO94322.1 SMI1/KNR4 family protein [Pirellulaceae bacterium]HMP71590.1 SMI1/KNR4 family protein [Pirellulaceae bacterium]